MPSLRLSLLVAALSGPILGEKVGWRRWAAIGAGFIGVLIILQPGSGVLTITALIPLLAATMYAVYSLLTRYVARQDPASVSFFWTGIVCAAAITPPGMWHWQWMTPGDAGLMAVLCCTAILGHGALIKAYALAEAAAIQPFAYFQLGCGSADRPLHLWRNPEAERGGGLCHWWWRRGCSRCGASARAGGKSRRRGCRNRPGGA